ncbi:MAG: hypothetical protein HW416_485 [Chloroflexi bacterium]|nr:hypothetical protein [Chloroflexota bacterium]
MRGSQESSGLVETRWKVAGELTQDEMNEAVKSLHRVDCTPSFRERYVRGGAARIVDLWLGIN